METQADTSDQPSPQQDCVLANAAGFHLLGEIEKAALLLESALERTENKRPLLEAIARLRMETGEYGRALEALRPLASSGEGSAEIQHWIAVCLEKEGQFKEAAAAFTQALRLDPSKNASALGLAVTLLRLRKPEQSLNIVEALLRLDPRNRPALLAKGVALQLLGRVEEARALYTEFATGQDAGLFSSDGWGSEADLPDPDRLARAAAAAQPAFEGLVSTALATDNLAEARQYTGCLTEVAPNRAEGWFYHGLVSHKLGSLPQAIEAYEKAVRLDAGCAAAWLNLGVAYRSSGRLDRALDCLRTAAKLAPRDTNVLWNLALALHDKGDQSQAAHLFRELTARHPEKSDYWIRLGACLLSSDDDQGAVAAFHSALQLIPQDSSTRLNLGVAYMCGKRFAEARKEYEAVLAEEPSSTQALTALASLAAEEQDWQLALDLQSRLIAQGQRSPQLLYSTGVLLQQMERTEEAVHHYRQALEEDPSFVAALVNLGHALDRSGDHQGAAGCWRKALELRPELGIEYFAPAQEAGA